MLARPLMRGARQSAAIASYPASRRDRPQLDARRARQNAAVGAPGYSSTRRSRSAFAMTDNELRVMAALAQMGLMRRPRTG